MDAVQRAIVLHAIDEVCRHKGWSLLAIHVRKTHVHVVVRSDKTAEFVMNAFKSYASRALNSHSPGHGSRLRWARHGSTRHLWSQQIIDAAMNYALTKQGEVMAHLSAP
jgi:REP element-mobilizing transposase RayT